MATQRVSPSVYDDEYFKRYVDRHEVEDISIPAFYKPHTITLLLVTIFGLALFVYSRDFNQSLEKNLFDGAIFMVLVFLIMSTMILPNGLFVRPHPIIWRLTLGASYVYLLIMIGTSFLTLSQAKSIMYYIAPDLRGVESAQILNKSYGENCNTLTFERIWSDVDIFVVAHFFGWVVKAMLMRHYVILWVQSVNWEITELAFSHLMPNLNECWWDSIFFDIIICNGIGIHVGWMLCKWLEMKEYKWESITQIKSTKAKIKRAVLQFTPQSWTSTRWIGGDSSLRRAVMLSFLVIIWQIVELNSFLLKHIFVVKPSHFLTLSRLAFITLASGPSIRQYYQLTTNPHCRRMGSQLWVFMAILMVELLVCIKLGSQMFEKTIIINLFYWLTWLVISSFLMVYFCLWTMKDNKEDKDKNQSGSDEEKTTAEMLDEQAKYCALCHRHLNNGEDYTEDKKLD